MQHCGRNYESKKETTYQTLHVKPTRNQQQPTQRQRPLGIQQGAKRSHRHSSLPGQLNQSERQWAYQWHEQRTRSASRTRGGLTITSGTRGSQQGATQTAERSGGTQLDESSDGRDAWHADRSGVRPGVGGDLDHPRQSTSRRNPCYHPCKSQRHHPELVEVGVLAKVLLVLGDGVADIVCVLSTTHELGSVSTW